MKLPSSKRPWVAASLTDFGRLVPDARRAAREGADLLEIRADLFPARVLDDKILREQLRAVRRAAERPLLLTLRRRAEGGKWPFSEIRRAALIRALMPSVDGVDVEGAARIAPGVLREARRLGKWVVLSHHDFKKTPSHRALEAVAGRFSKSGAQILKVAAMPRRPSDVDRLMEFCSGLRGRRAFIAMGPLGRKTRVEPRRWGSCLTFASVGRPSAPGQLGVKELAGRIYSTFT
jgi:3-dehydroquinate dehydratase-1